MLNGLYKFTHLLTYLLYSIKKPTRQLSTAGFTPVYNSKAYNSIQTEQFDNRNTAGKSESQRIVT